MSSTEIASARVSQPRRSWFRASQRILGRDWPTAYLFVFALVFLLASIKAYPFLEPSG